VASLRAEINNQCLLVHINLIYIEYKRICQSIKKGDFLEPLYNYFMDTHRRAKLLFSFLLIHILVSCNIPQSAQEGTLAPTGSATLLPPPAHPLDRQARQQPGQDRGRVLCWFD
jgi:hypothetical protein